MNGLLADVIAAHGGIEGEETWRVLRARFPGSIETHSLVQDVYVRS